MSRNYTFFALLAAVLYAINSPFSKILLSEIPPTMLAALLYLGAGIGIFIVRIVKKVIGTTSNQELPLTKADMTYTIAMIILDIAAPIFLMIGLSMSTPSSAALLNNFEIVATSVIALAIFKEAISKRLWLAIVLVTISSIILTLEDVSSLTFSLGSVFVLLACICWGFENNCTRKLSNKNPLDIVIIKGIFSGLGAFIIAFIIGERTSNVLYILSALALGFVAYGLSIYFYIYAQRGLGAAKTSTYYAVAPFIGSGLSLIIFREVPSLNFMVALIIMIAGTVLATEKSEEVKS